MKFVCDFNDGLKSVEERYLGVKIVLCETTWKIAGGFFSSFHSGYSVPFCEFLQASWG